MPFSFFLSLQYCAQFSNLAFAVKATPMQRQPFNFALGCLRNLENEFARLRGVLLLLLISSLPVAPVLLENAFAQEDDAEYDSRAEEEYEDAAAEEEYYEEEYEEQVEGPDDYYYEDDRPFQPVETTPFDDLVTISEQEIVTLNVLANDRAVIGWQTSPSLVEITEPEFGEVIVNSDNTITYAPSQVQLPSGYEKADIVKYTASAGEDSLYTGMVTIRIQQVNDPPVAYSANYTIKENQETAIDLGAYDEDNDGLTFTILSGTTFGKSDLDSYSGRLLYTPLYEFSGKESLTFQVSDGVSTSEVGTVVITVLEVGGESSPATYDEEDEGDSSPEDEIEDNSTSENAGPFADAGVNFDALSGDFVSLDGGESYYGDGDSLTYSWSQLLGPEVLLSADDVADPTFGVPEVESETELVFELAVSDGNLTDTASVTVTVLPISIDLVPNIYPNSIDLGDPDSEIPVAIIGSSVIDASASIDEESLRLGPGFASAVRFELSDSDGDGITDHVSYYRTGDLGLEPGDKTACFSGLVESVNGVAIEFDICKNVKVNA